MPEDTPKDKEVNQDTTPQEEILTPSTPADTLPTPKEADPIVQAAAVAVSQQKEFVRITYLNEDLMPLAYVDMRPSEAEQIAANLEKVAKASQAERDAVA